MVVTYRSKLFVPGNRPELFHKARRSGADAISIDLEDAVPAGEKDRARQLVQEFLAAECAEGTSPGADIGIRLNSRPSGLMIEDVLAVVRPGLSIVNLPKVEDPADILLCADLLDHVERHRSFREPVRILATIESPAGIRHAAEIATAHPRLAGLQFGVGDFQIAMGMAANPARLMPAWMAVVGAAREAGIAPYDSAYAAVDDLDGFEAWAREAKACGFAGKSCVHPRQVAGCNRVFAPSATEIEDARAVVEAYDAALASGLGAITFRGRLVDFPIAEQARRIAGMVPAEEIGPEPANPTGKFRR